VARQVAEGFLSVDRARKVYAVAVDPDGHVLADETARLRQEAG